MGKITCHSSLIALSAVLLGACGSTPAPPSTTPTLARQVGYLEGRVSIGPLVPVERVGVPTPTTPPDAYAARSIDVFQSDGATLVVSVKIDSGGTYRVELPPGTYVVALAPTGIDRGVNLPQTVVVVGGQTIRLDIEIDTGIR